MLFCRYRAKIIRTQPSGSEALLIDDGRKVIVKSGKTLPKPGLDVPGQVVLIKLKDGGTALKKGETIEVKPIEQVNK